MASQRWWRASGNRLEPIIDKLRVDLLERLTLYILTLLNLSGGLNS